MIKLDEIINTREKKILFYGLITVALVVVIQFVALPAYQYQQQLKSQVSHQEKLIAWMQISQQEIAAKSSTSSAAQKTKTNDSFFTLLENTLGSLSLKPDRLEQQGNAILFEFARINAQTFFTLLVQLDAEYPIEIQRAEITRLADEGFVRGVVSAAH